VSQPPTQSDPTRRFSDRVHYYVRSRPKYPSALLDFCRTQLGLSPRQVVADIGSGTGFLSEMFVRNGNEVFAVEPNAEMRGAAESFLGSSPNFHSVHATAEATGLENSSVDFVTAGQAFHWFDPVRSRAEFARMLRPGGWVLLVWNERTKDADPFAQAYEQVVGEFQTDLTQVKRRSMNAMDSEAMAKFFAPAQHHTVKFLNPQFLNSQGLIARALSSSYLPLPGQPRCQEMLDRLGEIFAVHSQHGKVRQNYETRVFYGHLV
jgi:SAM-dependent methyltransferase